MRAKIMRMAWCVVACAAATPALQARAAGKGVDGAGHVVAVPSGPDAPAYEAFAPEFATAAPQSGTDHVWLLLSDAAPDRGWAAAADPVDALRQWCKADAARWILYELDAKGEPQLAYECGRAGAFSTAMISNINGLASVAPVWEVFDGKRVRGRIRSGSGACGDDYCEVRGDFHVDVAVTR